MLDLAQLEGRTLFLIPEELDVLEQAREIIGLFAGQAQEKGLSLFSYSINRCSSACCPGSEGVVASDDQPD